MLSDTSWRPATPAPWPSTIIQPTQILGLAGISHFTETGTGSATAEQGNNQIAGGP